MAELYRVTITGADDGVDPEALLDLSAEFPFVEWAILRSASRIGKPRYPTTEWLDRWYRAQQRRAPRWYPWAIHLCGESARRAMGGCEVMIDALSSMSGEFRVQLNGFTNWRLPILHAAERLYGVEWILQCSNFAAENHAAELRSLHPNISYLVDASGGEGIALEPFPRAENHVGYAGGIGPTNVLAVVTELKRGPSSQRFWIDMESGVRTDDVFDLAKVRAVLEACAPHVVPRG